MAGISLALKENLVIGLEYEMRSYASAVYTGADGSQNHPWLSYSLLRFGAEYAPFPWLTLRAGVRDQAEVFQPEGNPLDAEPVGYAVYSGGCGLTFSGVRLNLTYEYLNAKYTDMFVNNVNLNRDARHGVVVDLSYSLPWRSPE
jgi:opacity protein-like surface antigen